MHAIAGYHLHPATLDAALQAALLTSTLSAGSGIPADCSSAEAASGTVLLRQQLVSLRSFAPAAEMTIAADSGTGGSACGRPSTAPTWVGMDATTACLQATGSGCSLAQLQRFAFAAARQSDGRADSAAALQSAASATDFVYRTVWLADNTDQCLSAQLEQPASLCGQKHRICLTNRSRQQFRVLLSAQQPAVQSATRLLAVLQQSASGRDAEVTAVHTGMLACHLPVCLASTTRMYI